MTKLLKLSLAASAAAAAILAVASSSSAQDDGRVKIAAFVLATANAYSQQNLAGIEAAAKAAGNVDITVFDGGFDGAKQLGQIQDAVASGGFKGMVVFPNSSVAVVPGVAEAAAAGIPVVAAYAPIGPDANKPEPQVEGVIGTVWHPNLEDGKALGEMAVDACKEQHPDAKPCKVAYISGGNSILFEQIKLEEYKKVIGAADVPIELVAQQEGNFVIGDARTATENILQAHPDLNVISTSADQMTIGAQQAVQDAGLTGISLLGDGASLEGVAAVKDGKWFGTAVFLPVDEGRLATEMLIDKINGKDPQNPVVNVRDHSPVGTVFTAKTTGDFTAQWSAVGN
ncbi:MAG: sugar ABC transporter substrate-binding protein [Rhizobiaceae bacterium]|nr:sugar ABC transporter substrate-binding protein [Rhizobiaceae bacterium]